MTVKKIAARTLWNAGRYLQQRLCTPAEIVSSAEALLILVNAYNSVLKG